MCLICLFIYQVVCFFFIRDSLLQDKFDYLWVVQICGLKLFIIIISNCLLDIRKVSLRNKAIQINRKKEEQMTVINSLQMITTVVIIQFGCIFCDPMDNPPFPIHNYLQNLNGTCLSDEMPTMNNTCIKCKQFGYRVQQCSKFSQNNDTIYMVNVNIISNYKSLPSQPLQCNQSNGYIKQGTSNVCYHKSYEQYNFKYDNQSVDSPYDCISHPSYSNPKCYICGGISCDWCIYGYYRNSTNVSYDLCTPITLPSNCLIPRYKDNQTKCKYCQPSYYPDNSNKTCQPCQSGCRNCYQHGSKCRRCFAGYQLDQSSYQCNSINTSCTGQPNCSLCRKSTLFPNITICIKCLDGFILTQQKTKCVNQSQCSNVIQNCQLCYTSIFDQQTKCRKCISKEYYVDEAGQCQRCSRYYPNCKECTVSTDCRLCYQSYFYNTNNNNCDSCNIIPNCIKCQYNASLSTSNYPQCTSCKDGYSLSNNYCVNCDPIANCLNCSSPTNCTICKDGYTLNYTNNQCYRPTGCLWSDTLGNCSFCNSSLTPPYYLNITQQTCHTCPSLFPNCQKCSEINSNTSWCIMCSQNWALNSNESATVTACQKCSIIDGNCTKCVNKNQCTQCNLTSQTYINKQLNKCIQCQAPCKMCSSIDKCVSCIKSYLAVNDLNLGRCIPCWRFMTNCSQCQSGLINGTLTYSCLKCKNNNRIDSTNISSSNPCIPCSQFQYAFYGTGAGPYGQCKSCKDPCKQCISQTECTSCIYPFYQRVLPNLTVICQQKCGDLMIANESIECDLHLYNINDGCTNKCTIQPDFKCDWHSTLNESFILVNKSQITSYYLNRSNIQKSFMNYIYSICYYTNVVQMRIISIQKEKFGNRLDIKVGLKPYLHVYNQLTVEQFKSLFVLEYQGQNINSLLYTFYPNHLQNTINIQLNMDRSYLDPISIHLRHQGPNVISSSDWKVSKRLSQIKNSTIKFQSLDHSQSKAYYYTEDSLSGWKNVHTILQVFSGMAVVCSIASFSFKNLAGLQMIWILQSMYVSLFWYQQPLTLPILSLSGLSVSNGYNPPLSAQKIYSAQFSNTRLLYQVNPDSGRYSPSFLQVPYMVMLFPLVFLLSYIAQFFSDFKNPKYIVWGRQLTNIFSYDGLLFVSLFEISYLVNMGFALFFNKNTVENSLYAAVFVIFGLICVILTLRVWFKTPQPALIKRGIVYQPFQRFYATFTRYNILCLGQKIMSIYILTMIAVAFASIFGAFYPLMPFLIYIFLAFIIQYYSPYLSSFSNHRSCFYCLVIAFGYLIRVIYLFQFKEDASKLEGIANIPVWPIYLWIVLCVIAFVLMIADFVLMIVQARKQKKKRQEQFKNKLNESVEDEQKKPIIPQKNYKTHNKQLQNFKYSDYLQNKMSLITNANKDDDQKTLQLKIQKAKLNMKPKPRQINTVQYNSNSNVKKKQDIYNEQDIRDNYTLGNQKWVYTQGEKQKAQRTRLQLIKLQGAYQLTDKIFAMKQQLCEQKKEKEIQESCPTFNLMTKLMKQEKETLKQKKQKLLSQLDRLNQEHQQKQQNLQGQQQLQMSKQIKLQQLSQENNKKSIIESIMAFEKQIAQDIQAHNQIPYGAKKVKNKAAKKQYYNDGSFPQVQIYYKKVKKLTQEEIIKKNQERQQLQIKKAKIKEQQEKQKKTQQQSVKFNFLNIIKDNIKNMKNEEFLQENKGQAN